jgi:uncharacterized protein YodC (DUF2158 family)
MNLKNGNLVVHKANEDVDLTVRKVETDKVTCLHFDNNTLKQEVYDIEELQLSEYIEDDCTVKIDDEVQLKSGGPMMKVIKVNSGEAVCVWNDGKTNRKETFNEYELTEYKSIYDGLSDILNQY